ncbi:transmembrane protein 230 [Lamellibrachia satsuma]|nr:transmembrane protein 230 [Lamellibrachia satsuma]
MARDATKYHRMARADDGFTDIQFKKPPPVVPYKAICLAVTLFLGGSLLIVIGSLLLTGYIDSKYSDRTWPVLILGVLMFIPGSYHVHLAYYAWKGYDGYNFEDIPEFE